MNPVEIERVIDHSWLARGVHKGLAAVLRTLGPETFSVAHVLLLHC